MGLHRSAYSLQSSEEANGCECIRDLEVVKFSVKHCSLHKTVHHKTGT